MIIDFNSIWQSAVSFLGDSAKNASHYRDMARIQENRGLYDSAAMYIRWAAEEAKKAAAEAVKKAK